MSEMDFESAANALSEAANAPEPGQAPAPVAPETASPQQQTPSEVDPGATAQPDSFTHIDPNTLPPELQQLYKQMQGDYTRKTQEIADVRKSYEGIDVDRARQSLEFVEALESDPNFVVAVHQRLSEALQQIGYTPAEANAEAQRQMQEDPSLGMGYDEEEPDSALAKEVEELRQWKQQMEQERYENNLAAHLQRQEMAIRQSDPNLTEGEVDRIYQLAFAHGGDLHRAYTDYKAWKDDVLGGYLAQKGEVAGGVVAPPSGGHSTVPPEGFGTDLDAATKAATEHLRNILASS